MSIDCFIINLFKMSKKSWESIKKAWENGKNFIKNVWFALNNAVAWIWNILKAWWHLIAEWDEAIWKWIEKKMQEKWKDTTWKVKKFFRNNMLKVLLWTSIAVWWTYWWHKIEMKMIQK